MAMPSWHHLPTPESWIGTENSDKGIGLTVVNDTVKVSYFLKEYIGWKEQYKALPCALANITPIYVTPFPVISRFDPGDQSPTGQSSPNPTSITSLTTSSAELRLRGIRWAGILPTCGVGLREVRRIITRTMP
jgi:hypothetical protein